MEMCFEPCNCLPIKTVWVSLGSTVKHNMYYTVYRFYNGVINIKN